MVKMLAVLAVIVITVQIKMVSGIGNETIKVKVEKGDTVVLKCSDPEGKATWSGPDVNNVGQRVELYFSNNDKNPKLNLTEYSLQEIEGKYNLIIANFLEKNAGSYICSFTKDGSFRETKYQVSLLYKDKENETMTTSYTAQINRIISSISMPLQTTTFQCEMLVSCLLSCRRDTERHTAIDEITEQENTVENQLYQNSHVPPNGNSSEPDIPFTDRPVHDADLGAETGATSNYRNTDESTAVKLYECTPGLHYAEVLIKPVESLKNEIHGIENKTIYSGIDHSMKRGERRSDHSDNEREDDSNYIQNLDVNMRNYENTCLQ